MTAQNAPQYDSWNGESGLRWVARADERDAVLAPVADVVLRAAEPAPGSTVLDIGCGCGATTLAAAARVGSAGSVTGIDLSVPMLDLARRRAAAAGSGNAMFVHADAQDHAFDPGSFDLAISRFGTMFFADPTAAFTNIGAALRPGGRLCLATWQPLTANEWLMVPGAALLRHTELPVETPDGPGMFAQSVPTVVTETLRSAGFTHVHLDAVEVTFTLGSIDAAVDYLADSGPGRLLLDSIPDGEPRQAALADVRSALTEHTHDGIVRLSAGIWIITADRPCAEVSEQEVTGVV
jgi:ubiquinone/menaquinone biosynthesis C-methylase UbiE